VIGISRGSIGLGLGVARAGGAGNGLLNNLIAYWPLNEAAGANNALDLHSNGLTLTQTHSPGSAAGLVYAGARTLDGANDYFSRASEALLQTGDTDFTIAAWVYFSSLTASQWIVSKRSLGTTSGYQLFYSAADIGGINRLRFTVMNNDLFGGVYATTYGAVPTSTWLLVCAWHNSVADTINIQINDGAIDSVATSIGTGSDTNSFVLGAFGASYYFYGGRIGPVTMWKSAAGGGGVLSAAQRTALYNGSAGLAYANFTT